VTSFFFTFLKIYLNGQRRPFVYFWFDCSDLIASFGPLSDRRLDGLFLALSHWISQPRERAPLLEKQAHFGWFKVKVELGRTPLLSALTYRKSRSRPVETKHSKAEANHYPFESKA
jgi:hypothetical protein